MGIAAQGRDGVHHQDGAGPGLGHRGQFLHRVLHRGGSLIGLDEDRLDGRVGIQHPGHGLGIRRPAPFHRQALHLDPVNVAQLGPAFAEFPAVDHQGRVAGAQGVDYRPLHGAGAGGGKDHHFLLRLEQVLQIFPHLTQDLHELGGTVMNDGLGHGQLGFRGHRGRARSHQIHFHIPHLTFFVYFAREFCEDSGMYKFIFSALHCQVSRLTVVKKSTNPGRLAIIKQFRAFYQLFKVKGNGNLSVNYSPLTCNSAGLTTG